MARMVDVSDKTVVRRVAVAEGYLSLRRETLEAIEQNKVKKGDVIIASKLAGIQAAKATSVLLPLCHQVPLTSIDIELAPKAGRLWASCKVIAVYKTGVEMEALVGVTSALLNAWDMVKYLEKDSKGQYPGTVISDVRVVNKSKGGSADGS